MAMVCHTLGPMSTPARSQHADLVLQLASENQRLMDTLSVRPHLLNPYPNIITRLSRRSRKFRRGLDGREEPRQASAAHAGPRLRLVSNGSVA